MDEKELKELESDDTWDHDSGALMPPATNRRTVVSVAFPYEDIGKIRRAAEHQSMKLSEYIRSAAVDHATTHAVVTSIIWEGATASGLIYVSGADTARGTAGPPVIEEKEDAENVAA